MAAILIFAFSWLSIMKHGFTADTTYLLGP